MRDPGHHFQIQDFQSRIANHFPENKPGFWTDRLAESIQIPGMNKTGLDPETWQRVFQ